MPRLQPKSTVLRGFKIGYDFCMEQKRELARTRVPVSNERFKSAMIKIKEAIRYTIDEIKAFLT